MYFFAGTQQTHIEQRTDNSGRIRAPSRGRRRHKAYLNVRSRPFEQSVWVCVGGWRLSHAQTSNFVSGWEGGRLTGGWESSKGLFCRSVLLGGGKGGCYAGSWRVKLSVSSSELLQPGHHTLPHLVELRAAGLLGLQPLLLPAGSE